MSEGRAELLGSDQLDPLRSAVDAAPIGIMCVSATRGQYIFINAAFAELLGRDRDALVQSDPYQVWLDVTHPEDIEPERRELERLGRGECDRFRIEKRFVRPDGEARWVLAEVVASRTAERRLDAITGFFVDIHERKRAAAAEQELSAGLRHNQKLEALGRLAGGIAHDFNNRLLIIMGYTELIRRELPKGTELDEFAGFVLESASRASELTRQLLAYSRRQVLSPRVFDLNRAVDSMRRLLERVIGEHIELRTELSAAHPIFFDPGQIEQVILNLALNARDAMPKGGRLCLRTHDARLLSGRIGALPAGDYVVLEVSDTGEGIGAQDLSRIFEPFYTTKGVGKGTGLGLSSVEGIVKQSGGGIEVTSSPGEGATFTIYLPRSDREAVADGRAASLESADSKRFETVLVCDDDEQVRKLVVNLLGMRAFRILEASNGLDALQVAGAHAGRIHLLLTDLVMPELGGAELASELRQKHPELCVLFMSGYSDDAARVSGEIAASTRFLAKPFTPGELTLCISELLGVGAGRVDAPPE